MNKYDITGHIKNFGKKYVDAIEQSALSRRVGLVALAAAAALSAIGSGSMVHRLHVDLELHRLVAAADFGDSGDLTPYDGTVPKFVQNSA